MGGVIQAPAASAASDAAQAEDDIEAVSTTIRIWLLDDLGQRMGAAPYRLALTEEDVRADYAQDSGLIVVENAPDVLAATLHWGKRDDAPAGPPPKDEDGAAHYFLFSTTVFFDISADESGGIRRQLFNLGYTGAEDQQRAGGLS